jgi:tetratricopeptide (TPR) repeat protein
MANIETMLQGYKKMPEPDKTKELRSRFPLFHAMVIALCNDKEDATREFKKRLIADPESIVAHYGLGLILEREGKINEALNHLKIALKKKEGSIPIMYERLTFLPPVKDRVYYNLGLVYGRQDKLALAHYNLGIYFRKLKRREKALFHFNKARELAGSKLALKEKIDRALKGLGNR